MDGYDILLFTGPTLPTIIREHSMVPLINGLAIVGGFRGHRFINEGYGDPKLNGAQTKIHHLTCANRNCMISELRERLSTPRKMFLVIPIPHKMSGCITGGEKYLD
jgi:hypothetical protein